MTKKIGLLVLFAALAVPGASAFAQDWYGDPGYVQIPDEDYGGSYYPRHPQRWREQPAYDRREAPDYPYYYGDDDGFDADQPYPSRRRDQQRASIDPNQNFLDSGVQDDSQAALAISPIRRSVVPFSGYTPGTIVINTKERRLYLVQDDGTALKYGIGVGKQGFSWKGEETISNKRKWPDWTPPKEMIARRPELPEHMDGGLNNPLGARALYLGSTLYRIHGTNEPNSIGKAVSSGCIRMANPDVMDLYNRVGVGTRVVVL